MSNYRVISFDCETGEAVQIDMDRRDYLIYYYGLADDTTLEDAEAVAAQDEFAPESFEALPEQPQ